MDWGGVADPVVAIKRVGNPAAWCGKGYVHGLVVLSRDRAGGYRSREGVGVCDVLRCVGGAIAHPDYGGRVGQGQRRGELGAVGCRKGAVSAVVNRQGRRL